MAEGMSEGSVRDDLPGRHHCRFLETNKSRFVTERPILANGGSTAR
jgi:hypothetical protein